MAIVTAAGLSVGAGGLGYAIYKLFEEGKAVDSRKKNSGKPVFEEKKTVDSAEKKSGKPAIPIGPKQNPYAQAAYGEMRKMKTKYELEKKDLIAKLAKLEGDSSELLKLVELICKKDDKNCLRGLDDILSILEKLQRPFDEEQQSTMDQYRSNLCKLERGLAEELGVQCPGEKKQGNPSTREEKCPPLVDDFYQANENKLKAEEILENTINNNRNQGFNCGGFFKFFSFKKSQAACDAEENAKECVKRHENNTTKIQQKINKQMDEKVRGEQSTDSAPPLPDSPPPTGLTSNPSAMGIGPIEGHQYTIPGVFKKGQTVYYKGEEAEVEDIDVEGESYTLKMKSNPTRMPSVPFNSEKLRATKLLSRQSWV